jgi:hypothetical protein
VEDGSGERGRGSGFWRWRGEIRGGFGHGLEANDDQVG